MNTLPMTSLHSQQFKHKLTGDAVTHFKSYKGNALSFTERLDRAEKRLNAVIVVLVIALMTGLFVFFTR